MDTQHSNQTDPNAVAAGHNPHGLTNAQVETHLGWRLLNEHELLTGPCLPEIELWRAQGWDSGKGYRGLPDGWQGCLSQDTYRTKSSPAELRKARWLPEESQAVASNAAQSSDPIDAAAPSPEALAIAERFCVFPTTAGAGPWKRSIARAIDALGSERTAQLAARVETLGRQAAELRDRLEDLHSNFYNTSATYGNAAYERASAALASTADLAAKWVRREELAELAARVKQLTNERDAATNRAHEIWLNAIGGAKLLDEYSDGETEEETIGHICSKIVERIDDLTERAFKEALNYAHFAWPTDQREAAIHRVWLQSDACKWAGGAA